MLRRSLFHILSVALLAGGLAADEQEDAFAPENLRTIRLHTVDADGKAIEGVPIFVNASASRQIKNRTFTTDASGTAAVELPRDHTLVRMWTQHPEYVPLFIQWWPEQQPDGHMIPDEFTLTLQRGVTIGGTVVDVDGKPIEGAGVNVTLTSPGIEKELERPCISMWLAEGDELKTDAEGRWSISNVPPGDGTVLHIKMSHPEYLPSNETLSGTVPLARLRKQVHDTPLERGIVITGTVTDPEGRPIPNALVVRGEGPFSREGRQEMRTDAEGRYQVAPLPPGEVSLTAIVKGWAPQRKVLQVNREIGAVNFRLTPGQTLKMQFLDESGRPIPNVGVSIDRWQRSQSIYDIDAGIPRFSNDEGIYEWSWAPQDPISYSFHTEGYLNAELTIGPTGDDAHVVQLTRAVEITGWALDAETGEPIPEFDVQIKSSDEAENYERTLVGRNGKIESELSTPPRRVIFVIEADGYEPFETESLSTETGEIEFRAELAK